MVPNHCTDSVAVDPTGKSYASGGEDGYVRVHQFDKGYFDFTYEVERQAKAQGQM
jgi:translation initiation factor 3 subunit I